MPPDRRQRREPIAVTVISIAIVARMTPQAQSTLRSGAMPAAGSPTTERI